MIPPRCTCGRRMADTGIIPVEDGRIFRQWVCSSFKCEGFAVIEDGPEANLSRRTDGENGCEMEPGDEPRLLPMRGLPTSVADKPRAYRGPYKGK